MGIWINHNLLSMSARRNLIHTNSRLAVALQRLSSGFRINSAADDPAGMAISEQFRADIASYNEVIKNANYNVNFLKTAEGALQVVDDLLIKMRALAIQASNGTMTSEARAYIQQEFDLLKAEIDRIAKATEYNGLHMLDGTYSIGGTGLKFHIGIQNTENLDYYHVHVGDVTVSGLGNLRNADLTTSSMAQSSLEIIDSALVVKDSERAALGSYMIRMQSTIDQLLIAVENSTASLAQIKDADIAEEMSSFVKYQVLMQSGVAMLAQANMMTGLIASILSG